MVFIKSRLYPKFKLSFKYMNFRRILLFASSLFLVLLFVYCKKKKSNDPETEEPGYFDKSAMLVNYADSVIIPNLDQAKLSIEAFAFAGENFSQYKTQANLVQLRQRYIDATASFQHIATFEFGPSETEIIRSNFNTYPTDTNEIRNNISSGSYNLSAVSNLDAKGFPAIDFLLYGQNMSDAAILEAFTTGAKAAERTKYLQDCLAELKNKINNVVSGWNGGYRGTFINSTGSQIGSSLGLLVNQLDFEIDLLKNGKIGIPLGKKSLDVLLPEKCEAYYAKNISVRLAKECLANIENVYLGRSRSGTNGLGLDDYLVSLGAMRGEITLDEAIRKQFAVATQKLAALNEPLTNELVNNKAAVNDAYNELVKLLVLLKTDTPSALGIVITYQDGDGD